MNNKTVKSRASIPPGAKVKVKSPGRKPEKPAEPSEGEKLIVQQMEKSRNSLVEIISDLKKQISEIQLQAAMPITDWEFDFIRDKKDVLQKIKASGTPLDIKRLN